MPCQMKLTLEETLILPPSISNKYLNGDNDDPDETVTILTLSKDPLFIVAVTIKKSSILKHCPYNFFCVDNLMLSHHGRGYEISCTGTLSHMHSNEVTPSQYAYTFFSISVEDNDSITFHDQQVPLDNHTKRLMKIFNYSIYMSRSEIEDEYHAIKWQKRLTEEDNDASTEDNSWDDDDFQAIVVKSKFERKMATPALTQSQEVDELDEDSEEEQKDEIDYTSIQFKIDDDDDFQAPIIVKPRNFLNKKMKTKPAKKSSGCSTKNKNNGPHRKRKVDRRDKDDNYGYRPHKKKSELECDTASRRRTRSGGKDNDYATV